MGTPDFSVPALDALAAAGHEIAAVYTQPRAPRAGGRRSAPRPCTLRAEALGLPVRHPKTLRTPEAQAEFAALEADIAVVVAYGLILPQAVLDAPRHGCLNIHASLLPRWRGAAPIHRAVLAGDAETGICIMRMEEGLDTGPVLLRAATPIGPTDTTGDLHDRLAALGARLIVEALARLADLVPEPQPEDGVTYAAKIDKAEARSTGPGPRREVDRQIRGLSPFPGAWTTHDGRRLKLLRSRLAEGGGAPGRGSPRLTIACGAGAVDILEVQAEGRGRQDAASFLRGRPSRPEPGSEDSDGLLRLLRLADDRRDRGLPRREVGPHPQRRHGLHRHRAGRGDPPVHGARDVRALASARPASTRSWGRRARSSSSRPRPPSAAGTAASSQTRGGRDL
jgi:methionyl-tRNA formyltransferase